MATPPKTPPKPITFGKPEKSSPLAQIVPWLLVILGIGGIIAMILLSPREKTLVCKNAFGGAQSLTAIGSCTTE